MEAGTGQRLAEQFGRAWAAAAVADDCENGFGPLLEKSLSGAYVPREKLSAIAKPGGNSAAAISAAARRQLSVDQIVACPYSAFPAIDQQVLLRSPLDAFQRGEQVKVPFIAGANSFEASLTALSEDIARAAIGQEYDELLAAYMQRTASAEAAKGKLHGELFFVQPARYLAQQHARHGAPAYLYYFDQVPASQRQFFPGAPHGGEIAYVFGTPQGFLSVWDDRDRALADIVSAYWVRFAATGDPNEVGVKVWQPVALDSPNFLHLSNSLKVVQPDALADRTLKAAVHAAALVHKGQAENKVDSSSPDAGSRH